MQGLIVLYMALQLTVLYWCHAPLCRLHVLYSQVTSNIKHLCSKWNNCCQQHYMADEKAWCRTPWCYQSKTTNTLFSSL